MPQEVKKINDSMNIMADAPMNPVFLPDPSLLPTQGDAFGELTALLQQLQSQSYQPPKQGKLETILNSLASAAAIAASNDPGGTLSNQLTQRSQIQQNRENAERTRQGQIQTAMIQGMLDKARSTTSEQQTARKEGREFQYRGAEGQLRVAEQQQVDLNRVDVKNREMAQAEDFLNRTSDARTQRLIKENPEIFNNSVQLAQVMTKFVPTMPEYVARGIAEKLFNRNQTPFTKEEIVFNARYKQALSEDWKQDKDIARRVKESEISENEAQAEYYRKIAAMGGSKTDPILSNLADEYAKKAFSPVVKTSKGQIISVVDLPKLGLSGEFGTTEATPEETLKFQQEQLKAFTNLNQNMRGNIQSDATTLLGRNPKENLDFFRSNVESLRQKGRTDEQIRQALQVNGATPEQINQLVPSKVLPPNKGKSVVKALPPNYFNNSNKEF